MIRVALTARLRPYGGQPFVCLGVQVGVDRVIDHLGPALALQQRKRFRKDTVLILDGPEWPPHARQGG